MRDRRPSTTPVPSSRPSKSAPLRATWTYAAVAVFLGLLGAFVLLEVAFRFLPVREPFEAQPVTRDDPYLHFRPNNAPLFSMGWKFQIVNRVRINNYGFVNAQDYDPAAATPLLAVIGDSYVEAAHVPYDQTLQGRLASVVGDRGRVYSFASSGSPLSQYLAYAQLARERFRAHALAVVIVGNDFDESLMEYGGDPGFHYLTRSPAGSYSLELVPFEPPLLLRILRTSALARYVHGNGFVDTIKRRVRAITGGDEPQFVGNVAQTVEPERLQKSMRAVDYFLATLPRYSALPPERIALVIDGVRPAIYDSRQLQVAADSYFSQMRRYLIDRARSGGYRVVDLQPRFIGRHQRDGTRFEWPIDAHWNAAGHEEAVRGVIESGLLRDVFGIETAEDGVRSARPSR